MYNLNFAIMSPLRKVFYMDFTHLKINQNFSFSGLHHSLSFISSKYFMNVSLFVSQTRFLCVHVLLFRSFWAHFSLDNMIRNSNEIDTETPANSP